MNSSHSPLVTRRSARRYGSSHCWCSGSSLSKREPVALGDRSRPGRPRRRPSPAGRARDGAGGLPAYAGWSGLSDSTCLMSISSSSWCCCSWWKPSSMVSAQLLRASRSSSAVDEVAHPGVDVAAVEADVVGAGPGDHAALGAGVARPDRLVVAVEEEPVRVLEGREGRLVVGEHERLEEPGDVGAVPLRRGDVGHRLDGLVLRGQRGGEASRCGRGPRRSGRRACRRPTVLPRRVGHGDLLRRPLVRRAPRTGASTLGTPADSRPPTAHRKELFTLSPRWAARSVGVPGVGRGG